MGELMLVCHQYLINFNKVNLTFQCDRVVLE